MTFTNRFHSRPTANTPNETLPSGIIRARELVAAGYGPEEACRIALTKCPCGNELPFYQVKGASICAECFGEYYGE
jgi:hypothetical protein